jgi:hypothetical protein
MDGSKFVVFHSSALKSASDHALKERLVIQRALSQGKSATVDNRESNKALFRRSATHGKVVKTK